MPKLPVYTNKAQKCVLVACPGSLCMPIGKKQACVLVGIPRLPMQANKGTHRPVPSNMLVCAPIGIHKDIRYSNKNTCLFQPMCAPVDIHRELGLEFFFPYWMGV